MTAVLIRVPHDEWEHEGTIGWRGPRICSTLRGPRSRSEPASGEPASVLAAVVSPDAAPAGLRRRLPPRDPRRVFFFGAAGSSPLAAAVSSSASALGTWIVGVGQLRRRCRPAARWSLAQRRRASSALVRRGSRAGSSSSEADRRNHRRAAPSPQAQPRARSPRESIAPCAPSTATTGFFLRFLPPRDPRRDFFLGAASVGTPASEGSPVSSATGSSSGSSSASDSARTRLPTRAPLRARSQALPAFSPERRASASRPAPPP